MKILIADDHALFAEGYKTVLSAFPDADVKYAVDCSSAIQLMEKAQFDIDLLIIDEIMPGGEDNYWTSGTEVAREVRCKSESCKIIFVTSVTEPLKVFNIYHKILPDGFISKGECTPQNLLTVISKVCKGEIYYSETMSKSLKVVRESDFFCDTINRQIILLLSQGVRIKNLPHHLPLSLSAINKRISIIKDC